MQGKSKQQYDDPAQSQRFIEAARKAEADESEEGARRAFRKVTKNKKQRPHKVSARNA